MDLNPQRRIPDHLDTVLPSGRTVRQAANARSYPYRPTKPAARPRNWLVWLFFGGRP